MAEGINNRDGLIFLECAKVFLVGKIDEINLGSDQFSNCALLIISDTLNVFIFNLSRNRSFFFSS